MVVELPAQTQIVKPLSKYRTPPEKKDKSKRSRIILYIQSNRSDSGRTPVGATSRPVCFVFTMGMVVV